MRIDRLIALQRNFVESLPWDLAQKSRVVYERSGTLVIVADTSAVAHRLKQLAPRIVEKIVKFAPEVTSIHLEVQVPASSDKRQPVMPRIGPQGLASLRRLCNALPESQLRGAVTRMVNKASSLSSQDEPLKCEKRDDY